MSQAPFWLGLEQTRDPYAARAALRIKPGVDVVGLDSAGNAAIRGYIQGSEMSDPVAPAANSGRLYFRDNGAGKTQLVVRFPTGAIQIIATEP